MNSEYYIAKLCARSSGAHQLTRGRLTHNSLLFDRLGVLTTRALKDVNLRHPFKVGAAYQRHGALAVRAFQFGRVACGHGEVAHSEVRKGPGRGRVHFHGRDFSGHSAAGCLVRYICGVLMEDAIGRQVAQRRRGARSMDIRRFRPRCEAVGRLLCGGGQDGEDASALNALALTLMAQ